MLTLNASLLPGEGEERLLDLCARKLRAPVKYFRILKKSLDARDKSKIRWVYTLACSSKAEHPEEFAFEKISKASPRVVIAGAGPAGLFCALRLLDHGIVPTIVERGRPVEEREKDVERFHQTRVLDPESNVQFGEGGAGTFSDGKLNTQTNSPLNREVLRKFVRFGAPEEVEYLSKPHIGSDNLKRVVANIRRYILGHGGTIRFSTRLEEVYLQGGKLRAFTAGGVREEADALVLAIGHSARDTFETLLASGFSMEQKEFAAGVRIEHLQRDISRAQYGESYPLLPPADYKLVSHAAERAVFSFCMCPGGVVVLAASEEGGVAVNGMSNYAREGINANAAIVAQVKRQDFASDHPLAGVALQRQMERAAFLAAGGYKAPVQRVGDFLAKRESTEFGSVLPTHACGTAFAPVSSYLPPVLEESIRAAIPDMAKRLKGFDGADALLTGVESRTSSPVRILRGEDLEAVGAENVYPCGEGCGYAGGIMSAAADGIRVAAAIARRFL